MALKPMNDTVFGDLISEDAFDDLTNLLHSVTREWEHDSKILAGELAVAERQLTAQLDQKNKLHFMVTITAVGPDCKELAIGDTAILPLNGGTMVTVLDEQTGEPTRVSATDRPAIRSTDRPGSAARR